MDLRKPIIYGSLSGGIGYFSTLPFDYIKQHLQTKHKPKYIIQLIKDNGLKTMFRGGLVGLYSIVPQMAIKFTTFDILQKYDRKQGIANNMWKNGFIAGFVDGSFLGPILSIQSMQQMNPSLTYRDTGKLLLQNIKQTHHLIYPMALRNAFYTSILFGSCGLIKDKLNKPKYSFIDNLMIASISNIPAVFLCSFADVLRANQIEYFLHNKKYDMKTLLRDIPRKYGRYWMFQGSGGLFINFALRFPFTYALYQYFMNI